MQDGIAQVDLVTRRVVDPSISCDYQQRSNALSERARIIRIDAGPDAYIPKEQLWDHLDSFMDNLVTGSRSNRACPTWSIATMPTPVTSGCACPTCSASR